ncbi:RNA-directed DNA polymerase [Maritalea myrionectae]|uniref:RNA-directed DNA polymerase n=1 Tax=Maritalea myrionectae TaxID=454601 RepID=UPI0012EB61EA|nr:RNA-directed DNA polymerase [Maritalea myrionectae]
MSAHLSKQAVESAIDHLVRFGDTDIFPHLIELRFFSDMRDELVEKIQQIDLNSFSPTGSVEVLAPKSRYGFRVAHQLPYLDTIFFTAAVIEVGAELEQLKVSDSDFGPFAYRFKDQGDGSIFEVGHTFKDWIEWQIDYEADSTFDQVIFTDIADFYQRIYFHRIENVLRTASPNQKVINLIERVIKAIRAKQSYGIPVGCTASRLIAEAVLTDFDHHILSEEYPYTRFVDDMRIYIEEDEDPYSVLAVVAETLASEGLTLNAQKTRVLDREEYRTFLEEEATDTFEKAEQDAFNILVRSIYFDEDEPSEEELEQLRALNLVGMLEEQLEREQWDFGKIRAIFRALRLTERADCVEYIVENFEHLLSFIRDIVLLFDALKDKVNFEEFRFGDEVLKCLSSGAGHSVPAIRAWLIELYIRKIIPTTPRKLRHVERLTELDGRQIILAQASINNVAYFRQNKTKISQFSEFELNALLLGASCLPKDEFEIWIRAAKSRLSGSLSDIKKLYCDWVISKHEKFDEVVGSLND